MNIEQGAGSAGHPIPGLGNATAKEFPAVLTPMPIANGAGRHPPVRRQFASYSWRRRPVSGKMTGFCRAWFCEPQAPAV